MKPNLAHGFPLAVALALVVGGCGSSTPEAEPCSPAAFLPVLKAALDNTAEQLTIVEARVVRCRNGYARVYAVPDRSVCEPGVQHCYESEQLFLERVDDGWQIVTAGTGIGCEDGSVPAEVCRALGYG